MKTLLLALLAALALSGAAPVMAEPASLPGWTREADDDSVLMTSPADRAGLTVLYLVQKASPATPNVRAWFQRHEAEVIGNARVTQRSGLVTEEDILKETLILSRAEDGLEAKVHFISYPTKRGQQFIIVMHAIEIPDSDARVNLALDHIAALWRTKFALTSTAQLPASSRSAPPPVASAPPPSAPTTSTPPTTESGKNCRREPIWGPSVSAWCYPSGVCNDLVIKGYETVCD